MRLNHRSAMIGRRGAAMVETAVVLPVFFLLVFGLIEISRLGMTSQLLSTAANAGCRVAVINGKTQADVNDTVQAILNSGGITTYTFPEAKNTKDIEKVEKGEPIRVTISVPFRDVSWLSTPLFFGSAIITSSATHSSERLN